MADKYIELKFRLLPFGILMVILGLSQLYRIWIPESSIMTITGTVNSSNIYFNTVKRRQGESHNLEIIFYLNGHNKKFLLRKPVEYGPLDKEYTHINKMLHTNRTVSVAISKDDINEYEPYIYSISIGNAEVIKKETGKNEAKMIYGVLMITGIIFMSVPFIYKFMTD